MRTPFPRREAGGLTNRTVTVRTIPDFKHPRTGITAWLLLSATTEFLVIDLIAQHDPQTNAQLAGCRHAGFPQPLLHQFAAIESLQLGIAAYRMSAGLIPKKAQERTALFGQCASRWCAPLEYSRAVPRSWPAPCHRRSVADRQGRHRWLTL